jgi:hypothetical protein
MPWLWEAWLRVAWWEVDGEEKSQQIKLALFSCIRHGPWW